MKKIVEFKCAEPLIWQADEIVYLQKPYFCSSTVRQLKMSFMTARKHFHYDKSVISPCIVFICGGAFQMRDRNVWMPELVYYAKKGYAIASVEYSVLPFTEFPEQLQELKYAIRFLRAHAEEFRINPDKIGVMGESAGGCLATLVGTTSETKEFDVGGYLDQSSAVQAAVPWYSIARVSDVGRRERKLDKLPDDSLKIRVRLDNFPDATQYITKNTPPFCIMHGDADELVPYKESDYLYEKLTKAEVDTEYYLIKNANHADVQFAQPELKDHIVNFLDKYLK